MGGKLAYENEIPWQVINVINIIIIINIIISSVTIIIISIIISSTKRIIMITIGMKMNSNTNYKMKSRFLC